MEKEIRKFKIDYSLDWEYAVEIKKIREDLDAIEKLGATHVEIEPDVYYDSPFVNINAIANRIETDEEFADRVDEIERLRECNTRRELEELKRLELKYRK